MNILLIDDHPLFSFGFAQALSLADPSITVTASISLEEGLEKAVTKPELDLALIDYRLSDGDGITGLKRFGEAFPLVARVLISGDEDPGLVQRARVAGASGFIGKSLTVDQILQRLKRLAIGDIVFDTALRDTSTRGDLLPTARQLEVLALVAQGHPNKRIALLLGISERTVKLHVTALLAALEARNRTHLLVIARERGLI